MIAPMPTQPTHVPEQPHRRRWLIAGIAAPAVFAGCATPGGPTRADAALADSDWAQATRLDGAAPSGPWSHRLSLIHI